MDMVLWVAFWLYNRKVQGSNNSSKTVYPDCDITRYLSLSCHTLCKEVKWAHDRFFQIFSSWMLTNNPTVWCHIILFTDSVIKWWITCCQPTLSKNYVLRWCIPWKRLRLEKIIVAALIIKNVHPSTKPQCSLPSPKKTATGSFSQSV